jgi:hypothetical protein
MPLGANEVVMIPGVMVDFLARASVAIGATRDANLVPRIHWISGWEVDADGASVLCLVSDGFTGGLLDAMRDNGAFAMNAEVIGPHECYQFKGRYLDSRPPRTADRRLYDACRRRFADAVRRHTRERFAESVLHGWFREPALALRFEVREIYLQTPGPGAGARLYPREDG